MTRVSIQSERGIVVNITSQAPRPILVKRPGVQGLKGDIGNTGPANTLTIGTVVDGPTADATITGASPAQTLNLTLPKGDKGDTGDTGPSGTITSATASGLAAGASPTITLGGSPQSRTLAFGIPKGDTGGKGDKGDKGDKGEKGEKGDKGDKGDEGDKGDTGDTGAAATIAAGATATGAAGTAASVTNAGTSGAAIFNFTIPRGDKGETGNKGDKGETGNAGPANSLSIGTVGSGASAGATITGTSPSQTLNLVLPKGDKGDGGDDGWTPVFAVVADGARYVQQVTDWTGGAGTKPATGQYVGATGFEANIANAVNIRGASGSGSGDMQSAIYDPSNVAGDAFARGNHTGTQAASTITGLATVATSGSYDDLTGLPTLGTAAAQNVGAFATTAQGGKADTALQTLTQGANITITGTGTTRTISATSAPQVNADWDASSGVAEILNKPTLGTAAAQNVGAFVPSSKTTDIDANTSARHTHANKTVLDATTASFLTADKTKLNGINLALYQTLAQKGVANGYPGLDGSGKVPTAQLPDAVLGALKYQGTWNAATNVPAIPVAAAGNKGWYYMVQVAGSTSVNGTTDWQVGDWIVSNGARWDKIDNTDAVVLVAGLKGDISVVALQNALGLGTAAYQASGAFAAAVHGHADATPSAAGFMSAADKTKMDTVTSGATPTNMTNVGAAMAGPTPSTGIGDGDKVGGILSGGATLATWSWATVKTWIKGWITKADVGLGNVDNTADSAKPVSTAQAAAIAGKQDALSLPSQAEAEAGTSTEGRQWSAERVRQLVEAVTPPPSTPWPGVYAGTNANEVNFPIGHYVTTNGDTSRNSTAAVGIGGGNSYDIAGATKLSGTWRARGRIYEPTTAQAIVQRVA